MVPNSLIHQELKKRFNRVTSNGNESVNTEEWDSYFNEAYRYWVKIRVPVSKTNNKVRYDLRKLEVIDKQIDITDKKDTWVIAELPDEYYDIQRIVPVASKKTCKEHRELMVSMIQGNDWSETMRDPFWKPSFLWARTIADENSKGLRVGKAKDFEIIKVSIDYYRKPAPIYSPELSDCEYTGPLKLLGNKNQGFELDEMQMDEVADLAVSFACRDTGNLADAQSMFDKVVNLYKL